MDWYVIDKRYINYLRIYDKQVSYVEYGERLKLHIGIVLSVHEFHYYVPVSSAKPKHHHMSNSLDFHKLIDDKTGDTYAVININNMVPVPDFCIIQLKYDKITEFRHFTTEKEKTDYIYLLQKEKAIIDKIASVLQSKAQKLYQKYLSNSQSSLASRCCNFPLLEEKCMEYKMLYEPGSILSSKTPQWPAPPHSGSPPDTATILWETAPDTLPSKTCRQEAG